MNILIVGGAGYIGGALTDILKDTDNEIRVYDSLVYEDAYLKDINFFRGDIRDHDKLIPHVEWADTIVWLAAIVGDGACAIDPVLSQEINCDSVKWVTDYLNGKMMGSPSLSTRMIFMSTCSVYGAQDGILDEQSPIKPLSVYGTTKYEAEQYLLKERPRTSLIFRLGTVYGVGDRYSRIRLDLVVNVLTMKAATTGKLTVFGGDQFRPLIHVRDVANTIANNIKKPGYSGHFNLCSQNVRIVDLAYQVRNHFPDCEMEVTEMKFEDSRNYRASAEMAEKILKYKPEWSIDHGIEQIKKLINEERIVDIGSNRYSNHAYLEQYLK